MYEEQKCIILVTHSPVVASLADEVYALTDTKKSKQTKKVYNAPFSLKNLLFFFYILYNIRYMDIEGEIMKQKGILACIVVMFLFLSAVPSVQAEEISVPYE